MNNHCRETVFFDMVLNKKFQTQYNVSLIVLSSTAPLNFTCALFYKK